MHEYSIVQALIEQCEAHAKVHQADHISKVVIKVGVLSGVEPDLLATAFATFKKTSPLCHSAQLDMRIQPVLIECQDCQEQSTLEQHHYVCPNCQSSDIVILDGEEMFLMQLEMS